MALSDLYIVLFSLVYALLAGVVLLGLDVVGGDLATLTSVILFVVFVGLGSAVREVRGWKW
ncbi:MAG: hypothetical protein ABEJ61_06220 [Haloferacaceae archaeon]